MSLIARLLIGDNEAGLYSEAYWVEACAFKLKCHANYFHPNSGASYGNVSLTLRKPENLQLYDWYIEQGRINGKIEFQLSKGEDFPPKILRFEDAQCYSLSEEYDKNGESQVQLIVEFVAEEIQVDGIKFNYLNQ